MRYAATWWDAVIVADMAAFNDLVALDELWPYALAHAGMTGIPQARDAIAHADENSWSPMEVVMRLDLDLHGRHAPTAHEPAGVRPARPAHRDA